MRRIHGATEHQFRYREDFNAMLEAQHERWVRVTPDLGLPLAIVQAVEAEARGKLASPMSQIAQLAEEIHNHSSDHDVKQWAWDILVLTSPPRRDNDASRNR